MKVTRKQKYSDTDIIRMIEFLTADIYDCRYAYCAPLLADYFLVLE